MSLKVFHIVFVVLTTLLSLFVAMWGIREYAQQRSTPGLLLGLLFFVTAIALVVYGRRVYAKFKEIP